MGCGNPGGGNEITFSHILSPESEWHVGAAKLKELVEAGDAPKDTAYTVTIFNNASLSNHNQQTELDMVQGGSLVMTWESSILLSTVDQAWSVYSLPWLLDDYGDAEAICEGPLGQEMLQRLESKRLVGLGYGFNGFRQLTNSKQPVLRPEDMNGMKIRVPSIKMYIALFELWGAQPSSMNFGELIPALRSGAMDGQENPLHVIQSAKLYEVQKYLSVWQYSFDPLILCVNKDWWESQPEAGREFLKSCAEKACAIQRQTVKERETQHLESLKQNGMEISILSAGQRDAFRKSANEIYNQYRDIIGEELLTRFVTEAEKLRDLN